MAPRGDPRAILSTTHFPGRFPGRATRRFPRQFPNWFSRRAKMALRGDPRAIRSTMHFPGRFPRQKRFPKTFPRRFRKQGRMGPKIGPRGLRFTIQSPGRFPERGTARRFPKPTTKPNQSTSEGPNRSLLQTKRPRSQAREDSKPTRRSHNTTKPKSIYTTHRRTRHPIPVVARYRNCNQQHPQK